MKKILFVLIFLCFISSCSDNRESKVSLFCMDTVMEIKAYGKQGGEAIEQTETELKRLEALFDRKSKDSDIYNIKSGDDIKSETAELLKRSLEISAETDGAFDMTIAPVMDLWGFYNQQYTVPSDEEIAGALKRVDYRNVFFDNRGLNIMNNAAIDLGGIAKGFASDKAAEIFRECGVKSAIINLGGNVYALGRRPDGSRWSVAVTNPFDKENYALTVNVEDKSVITSGGYQRFFEKDGKQYHHIINPKTGKPAENGVKSVTVISSDCTSADALSTALFVMGKDKAVRFLQHHSDTDAIIITDEKTIYYTPGLEGSIKNESGMEMKAAFSE